MNTWPAIKSASEFLLGRLENRKCDSDGVDCCERCNAIFLAKEMLKLEPISRHLSSVQEWIKVTPETMPKEDGLVLVAFNNYLGKTISSAAYFAKDGSSDGPCFCYGDDDLGLEDVIAWMPLPAPPSASTQHE